MSKTETADRTLAGVAGDTAGAPTRDTSPYRTLADLRAANAANGFHFFERGTMKFWKSRIESTLIRGRFFITSEDTWGFGSAPVRRIYAVRHANDDATITTVRRFMRNKDDARELIARYVRGEHVRNWESGQRCFVCGQYSGECGGVE